MNRVNTDTVVAISHYSSIIDNLELKEELDCGACRFSVHLISVRKGISAAKLELLASITIS